MILSKYLLEIMPYLFLNLIYPSTIPLVISIEFIELLLFHDFMMLCKYLEFISFSFIHLVLDLWLKKHSFLRIFLLTSLFTLFHLYINSSWSLSFISLKLTSTSVLWHNPFHLKVHPSIYISIPSPKFVPQSFKLFFHPINLIPFTFYVFHSSSTN